MDRMRPTRASAAALGLLLACALGAASGASGEVAKMRAFATELLVSERYEDAIAAFITIAGQTPDDARSHYDVAAADTVLCSWSASAAPAVTRRHGSGKGRMA